MVSGQFSSVSTWNTRLQQASNRARSWLTLSSQALSCGKCTNDMHNMHIMHSMHTSTFCSTDLHRQAILLAPVLPEPHMKEFQMPRKLGNAGSRCSLWLPNICSPMSANTKMKSTFEAVQAWQCTGCG